MACDLYARRLEGRRLHPGEYVICADEKSQLQALARGRGIAQPFEWTFTCAKLDALLARLTAHEPDLRLAAQSYAATSTSAGVTIAIVRGRLSRSRPT